MLIMDTPANVAKHLMFLKNIMYVILVVFGSAALWIISGGYKSLAASPARIEAFGDRS